METKETKSTVWKVLSLNITESFQIINFDLKIAKHIKSCKGIRFSIVESPRNLPEVLPQIGIMSITFNNRTKFPLQYIIDLNKNLGNKKESISINQELDSTQRVHQGYYIDTGKFHTEEGQFIPYTIKIYLELENR